MIRIANGRTTDSWASVNVIIDIFRSTTTIPIILARNARYMVPFSSMIKAMAYKRRNPGTVLIGERYSVKPPYFDYDNSPAEIDTVDFSGKVVAFTSTNGTYVLSRISSGRVFFASFVNFSAVLSVLRNYDDVLLLPSNRPIGRAREDIIFADLIREALEGKNPDVNAYVNKVIDVNDNTIAGVSTDDLKYCTKVDYVSIVPEYRDGRILPMA